LFNNDYKQYEGQRKQDSSTLNKCKISVGIATKRPFSGVVMIKCNALFAQMQRAVYQMQRAVCPNATCCLLKCNVLFKATQYCIFSGCKPGKTEHLRCTGRIPMFSWQVSPTCVFL